MNHTFRLMLQVFLVAVLAVPAARADNTQEAWIGLAWVAVALLTGIELIWRTFRSEDG